jgi:hypothetical protein
LTIAPSSIVRLAIAGITLAATVSLSGCAFLPQLPGVPGIQGGSGSSSDDSTTGSTTDTPNGSDDIVGLPTTVPATFPAEVPLPALDVAYSLDLGTGWAIGFSTDDPTGQWTTLDAQMVASGWEVLMSSSSETQAFGAYENGTYQVQISAATAADSGYDTGIVAYNVVPLS